MQSRLPEVLRDFTRVHRAVDLELTVGLSGALFQALDAAELDLVLAKRRPGEDRGRLVRRERLVWIAADSALADPVRPLPLILYPPPSISRGMALEALENAGRSWRIVCTSASLSGLNAAALAGLGICVQADGFVPTVLRCCRARQAFPSSATSSSSSPAAGAPCAARRTSWRRPFSTMPIGCRVRPAQKEGRMPEDFAGKIAVVTGGGSGIGAATCRAFANAGAHVAVVDRDATAAQRVASEIAGNRGNAAPYPLDVTDRGGFAALAAEIAAKAGGIDILVNGAGVTVRGLIADMRAEDWDRVLAVNLTGAFNGIQAVLPYMRARGGGRSSMSPRSPASGFRLAAPRITAPRRRGFWD